jgi:transposase InsO family protein
MNRACLNKLTEDYFLQVLRHNCALSDHGTHFNNQKWKQTLSDLEIEVKYSPIGHPQSTPSERVMRGLGTFFKIYCNNAHKKWPEPIPHMEIWLNSTVSSTTGYAPIELMFHDPKPDIFREILKKTSYKFQEEVSFEDKLLRAYAKLKLKAHERKKRRKIGTTKWEPKVNDQILLRIQPTSDAARAISSKFVRPFEGPYKITEIIPSATFEIADMNGRVRDWFNKKALKPFLRNDDT